MDIRNVPGTTITTTGEAIYTPPIGEDHIRNLLANWENYLHADDLNVLDTKQQKFQRYKA